MVESKASEKVKRLIIWMWACVAIRRGLREQIATTQEQSRITFYNRRREIFQQLTDFERQAVSDVGSVFSGVCQAK
jgi:hypothetical protein